MPDVVRSELGYIGTVTQENPRPGDMRGLVGRKVLIHTAFGQSFEWRGKEYTRLPLSLDMILAVLHEGRFIPLREATGKVTVGGEAGVQRCRHCKSKGKANIILTHGYCPKCKRYPNGKMKRPPKVIEDDLGNKKTQHVTNVSDEERELYGGTDEPKKPKGTVISYLGQKARS